MQYGVAIFPTDYSMPMAKLGPALEQRGFESLWVAEHSHIPLSRESPYPGGGDLPKMYYDTFDPFVALTAAAVTTSTLKIATGVCLVVQRDPIHTAKLVSSLDQISGGRFLFGVGGGWNLEEMRDHGTDTSRRFGVLRERVEAMKAIWGGSKPEYHGSHVDFAPMMSWPKPVQKPHPPVHVGGGHPGGPRRAVRYGDGWMPLGFPGDGLEETIPAFRRTAEEAGRDPASLEVSIYGISGEEKLVEHYRAAGADRIVFGLPPADEEELLPVLDALAGLARKLA